MTGQIGFDEGKLFEVLAKEKYVEERFTYNKDGTVKKRTLKTVSWWDTVMAAGGLSLVFAIVTLVKTISTKIPEWFDEEEQQDIKDNPGLFLALGPIGWKVARKKAELAVSVVDAAQGTPKEVADLATYAASLAKNWGFVANDQAGDLIGTTDETEEMKTAKRKKLTACQHIEENFREGRTTREQYEFDRKKFGCP